jgi:predicted dehydrogenase
MMVQTDWAATVYGTGGKIRVPNPWVPEPADGAVEVTRYADWKTERLPLPGKHYYAYQAEAVARALPKRQAPEMSWADTLGNMKALDALRASMGLTWSGERPAATRR